MSLLKVGGSDVLPAESALAKAKPHAPRSADTNSTAAD